MRKLAAIAVMLLLPKLQVRRFRLRATSFSGTPTTTRTSPEA